MPWEVFFQKTPCGCSWSLFGGSQGKLRESPRKIVGYIYPNREMLQILELRAPGKANLPETLGQHSLELVPTFRAVCFFEIDSSSLLEFSSLFSDIKMTRVSKKSLLIFAVFAQFLT